MQNIASFIAIFLYDSLRDSLCCTDSRTNPKRYISLRQSITNKILINFLLPCAIHRGIFLLLGLLMLSSLSLLKIPAIFLVTDSDWIDGFHHPLEGWDHILTMIAVGIWSAQSRRQAIFHDSAVCHARTMKSTKN